ncbi:unnamed protein product [Gordionus sp. m RMFG-2023]|uniref:sodium-dependent phosphate transport protein 2A-like n=1 Tax=Gordionus sp. m RMFG-2023 TaxID=3053472 RepID=UPI0030DFDC1E
MIESNQNEIETEKEDWDLPVLHITRRDWKELNPPQKIRRVIGGLLKFLGVLTCLYFFICSLDFMTSAFRLLGAKAAGKVFADSSFLNNPITALMVGVLVAALLHSSAIVVSVIIAMVASQILKVRTAIPIIMGADIGTAITNIIVSIIGSKGGGGTSTDKRLQFKRAFAAATVHDMFNWLSVVVFLPLEIMTGFLFHLSSFAVNHLKIEQGNYTQKQFIKRITKPFTTLFVELDEKALNAIAKSRPGSDKLTILKRFCSDPGRSYNFVTATTSLTGYLKHRCHFLLAKTNLSDNIAGIILLIFSLTLLGCCLVGMVKILHSILKTKLSLSIRKIINYRLPGKLECFTGYFAIMFGAFVTFLIQSSSIFTSTLTPLVGIGLVALENVYPLTLGSNIGTTTTGLIASFTVTNINDDDSYYYNSTHPHFEGTGNATLPYNSLKASVQIALIHTFYNILGVLVWYPIPFMRWPLFVAKFLGEITYKYEWFSLMYLVLFYFFLPLIIFSLSALGGLKLLLGVFIVPFVIILLSVLIINKLQQKSPKCLPPVLRTWDFLPECLRSLKPIDSLITTFTSLFKGRFKRKKDSNLSPSTSYENPTKSKTVFSRLKDRAGFFGKTRATKTNHDLPYGESGLPTETQTTPAVGNSSSTRLISNGVVLKDVSNSPNSFKFKTWHQNKGSITDSGILVDHKGNNSLHNYNQNGNDDEKNKYDESECKNEFIVKDDSSSEDDTGANTITVLKQITPNNFSTVTTMHNN